MSAEPREEVDKDLEVEATQDATEAVVTRKDFNSDICIYVLSRSRSRDKRYRSRSREYRRDDKSRDMIKEGRCFHCEKRGHIKRDCPELRRSKSRSHSYKDKHRRRGKSYSSSRSRGRDDRGKGRSPSSGSRRGGSRSPSSRGKSYDRSVSRHNPEGGKD